MANPQARNNGAPNLFHLPIEVIVKRLSVSLEAKLEKIADESVQTGTRLGLPYEEYCKTKKYRQSIAQGERCKKLLFAETLSLIIRPKGGPTSVTSSKEAAYTRYKAAAEEHAKDGHAEEFEEVHTLARALSRLTEGEFERYMQAPFDTRLEALTAAEQGHALLLSKIPGKVVQQSS